ncbi:hypothetical protein GCM10010278_51410 [Streptomyces melanogenes]|nr:hypothetical protein GCM10010278_51410 [Streptomyces melanogenes]
MDKSANGRPVAGQRPVRRIGSSAGVTLAVPAAASELLLRPRRTAVGRRDRTAHRGRIEASFPHTTSRYRDVNSGVQVVSVM